MTLRKIMSDRLTARSVPEEPEHLTDAFDKGVAAALQRRGIVTVPGMKTPAEQAADAHRQRVKDVVAALTPRAPTPDPEPEPVLESLPTQLRRLIGSNPTDLALNGQRLLDHAASQLDPLGANRSATDGHSAGSSGV
jgi:hypothetical protein